MPPIPSAQPSRPSHLSPVTSAQSPQPSHLSPVTSASSLSAAAELHWPHTVPPFSHSIVYATGEGGGAVPLVYDFQYCGKAAVTKDLAYFFNVEASALVKSLACRV